MNKICLSLKFFCFVALFFFIGIFSLNYARAAENHVSINVVATNTTSEKGEKMPVRQDLPREIKKEDIIETGGMEVKYDEEKALYYLYAEVDIEPQESKSFKIVIRDIWQIPESDLSFLKEVYSDKSWLIEQGLWLQFLS